MITTFRPATTSNPSSRLGLKLQHPISYTEGQEVLKFGSYEFISMLRLFLALLLLPQILVALCTHRIGTLTRRALISKSALSNEFLENDLVAVQKDGNSSPRFCVVRPDLTVSPLCQHEDDVETDLFIDPRCYEDTFWEEASDDHVRGTYGEGWYGQRPVPSLGGGPGYGADAQEIWSIDQELLERVFGDGVELPVLDIGIAHGEKARGGSF